jgi:hypothetical protein
MKNTLIILCLLLLASCKENTEQEIALENIEEIEQESTTAAAPLNKKPLSPHTSTMAMVGDAHIHFDYSSPGVRDRIVFGGLLPYDAVWQAGAHNATWMETNKDLKIAGKELKAGKYGFFVIPNKEEWTVIFNTNWDQHGKDDYNEKDDVLRFKVRPKISEVIQEHLEYNVVKMSETSGTIGLSWEKITIKFPFTLK